MKRTPFLLRSILTTIGDGTTYYIPREDFTRATNLKNAPREIDVEGEMFTFRRCDPRFVAILPGDAKYQNQAGTFLVISKP